MRFIFFQIYFNCSFGGARSRARFNQPMGIDKLDNWLDCESMDGADTQRVEIFLHGRQCCEPKSRQLIVHYRLWTGNAHTRAANNASTKHAKFVREEKQEKVDECVSLYSMRACVCVQVSFSAIGSHLNRVRDLIEHWNSTHSRARCATISETRANRPNPSDTNHRD